MQELQTIFALRNDAGQYYTGRYWRAWQGNAIKLYRTRGHARCAITHNRELLGGVNIVEFSLTEVGQEQYSPPER